MTVAYSYLRFSSKPQERGDSLRRQIALAREYAARHSLTLDERSYQDLGISAFKGKNAIEGALGAFLKAVDDGVVSKGSYLLVESMDRLSRQQVDEALELFLSIIRRGITIVTLQDNQTYSRERIKADKGVSLIISITVMMRAHEESATKSARIKAAWQGKRDRGEILTAMGPGWLELNEARTKWKLIPEKVATVKKVFALAASGLGGPTIADRMNEAGEPVLKNAAFWEPGVVMAILKNSAVIGVYTPRKADAAPIEGYYPAIIKPEQFYLVQEHIAKRRGTGGRKGTNIANLFSGIAVCKCGSRLRFVSASKPHVYLRCVRAYSNVGCSAPVIPYNDLEEDVMHLVLTWAKLPLDNTKVEDPSVVLRGELEDKQRQRANYIKVIESATDVSAPTVLLKNLARLELEIADLERKVAMASAPTPISSAAKEAVLLWKEHQRLVKTGGQPLYDLRLRLQAELKRMLTKIVLPTELAVSEGVESLSYVLYGPLVDANPFESAPFFTEDGGWREELQLPKWGFGRRRTNRQRQSLSA